jgi:ABC-type branched-subunit amino acid transport system substrate-binding protein
MTKHVSRRTVVKSAAAGAAIAASGLGFPSILRANDEIKVGFIGPISGFYALQGTDMLQCTQLAVDEVNAAGGAAGRELALYVEDNKLEPKATIDAARKLIHRDEVDVVIGVLASSSRVAAVSVTEPAKQLFIYPTFYEGGECRKYLICTGTVPNQSVDPTVPWLAENVGKSIYVIGNDFEYPRGMAVLIKDAIERVGGTYAGEEYYPFGTSEYGPIFQRIKAANPDIVWVMDANQPVMVQQYRSFGMKPQLISTILHENWTTKTDGAAEGVLANASYFTSVDSPENKKFLSDYRARHGESVYPTTFGERQYDSVWLYAKAVEKAGSADKDEVVKAISQVDFHGPQGRLNVLASNQHARTNSIIGRVNKEGLIDIVKEFGQVDPVVPGCSLA